MALRRAFLTNTPTPEREGEVGSGDTLVRTIRMVGRPAICDVASAKHAASDPLRQRDAA